MRRIKYKLSGISFGLLRIFSLFLLLQRLLRRPKVVAVRAQAPFSGSSQLFKRPLLSKKMKEGMSEMGEPRA